VKLLTQTTQTHPINNTSQKQQITQNQTKHNPKQQQNKKQNPKNKQTKTPQKQKIFQTDE